MQIAGKKNGPDPKIISGQPKNSDIRVQIDWLNESKRNWAIFQNFNFWMIRLTKTPTLPNIFFLYNWNFNHSKIEVLKDCSAFLVRQFLWREKIGQKLREFIFHKIPSPVISNLDMLEVLDLSNNYFMGMDQVFFDVLNRKQKPRLKMVYLQVCTNADICFCLSLKKSRKKVVILRLQY